MDIAEADGSRTQQHAMGAREGVKINKIKSDCKTGSKTMVWVHIVMKTLQPDGPIETRCRVEDGRGRWIFGSNRDACV